MKEFIKDHAKPISFAALAIFMFIEGLLFGTKVIDGLAFSAATAVSGMCFGYAIGVGKVF